MSNRILHRALGFSCDCGKAYYSGYHEHFEKFNLKYGERMQTGSDFVHCLVCHKFITFAGERPVLVTTGAQPGSPLQYILECPLCGGVIIVPYPWSKVKIRCFKCGNISLTVDERSYVDTLELLYSERHVR